MPTREHILHKVRTALGRNAGQAPTAAPPPRLQVPSAGREERVRMMLATFPGKTLRAVSPQEALDYIAAQLDGGRAVASRAPALKQLGILEVPGVREVPADSAEARHVCAESDIGITTAEYGLADTGALVVLAGVQEPRLISLLPSIHITVLSADRILTGLDELFTLLPDPAAISSSMVLIGGPSRTADIEQILTLGVHGPRELHLVMVDHQ